jgi:hypothetical protein
MMAVDGDATLVRVVAGWLTGGAAVAVLRWVARHDMLIEPEMIDKPYVGLQTPDTDASEP